MSALTSAAKRLRRVPLRGVIFDMDGTLTKPNLDFKEMYRRCGVPLSDDLLVAIAGMPKKDADAANAVIDEMEAEGRRTLELFPGATECAKWLQRHGIPMAMVTRNTKETVTHLHNHLWLPAGLQAFNPAISRDNTAVPAKPDPGALHVIAEQWGMTAGPELLMVGDSVSNDIGFGKAAGVSTALLDSGRRYLEGGSDGGADFCVENLALLPRMLFQSFEIVSDVTAKQEESKAPTPATEAGIAAAGADLSRLASLGQAELNACDASGNTPLIWAANAGAAKAVDFLLSKGVDVNIQGCLGATAICRASRYGHAESLSLLLAAPGINCNIPNNRLQSPLHFAAFKKNPGAVKLLLEHGANTLILDRKGRTPAEDTSDETIRDQILEVRAKQMATPSLWQP